MQSQNSSSDVVVDSHIHFYDSRYPTWSGAALAHSDVTLNDYAAAQRVTGANRFVVVQPSTYGFDNRVLLNALAAAGEVARGVAVVSKESSRDELLRLKGAGVVGARANLMLGPITAAELPALAECIAKVDWHLQLNLTGAQLLECIDVVCALPVPTVIDHFGYVCREPAISDEVYAALRHYLERPDAWLKMSAPYVASGKAGSDALTPYVDDLVSRCPTRLIWGSDWPHVTEQEPPDEQALFDIATRWMGASRRMILSDNPKKLYGF